MVILGIILVLVALLLAAGLLVGTSGPEVSGQDIDIQLFDVVTINLNPLTLVIAGMATMFLLWLGLVLIKTTLTRRAQQRKVRKEQAHELRERQAQEEQVRQEQERQAAVERDRGVAPGDHGPADATRPIARDAPPSDATRPIPRDGEAPRR